MGKRKHNEVRRTELTALLAAERAAKVAAEGSERWLQGLRLAAREAMTSLSLDEVLRAALESTAAVMGADAASILLANDDQTMMISRASIGLNKDIDLDVRVPRGQGFAGRILASRAPLVVADMRTTTVVSPTLRESGLRSLVGVPLISAGAVVGVMHVGSREIGRFSVEDAEILEVLGEPIAAAIQRVRLFEAERNSRLAAEQALERLRGLQRITAALANAGSTTDIYGVIVEETRAAFPDSDGGGSIWMMRDGRLELVAGNKNARRFPEIPLDSSYPPFAHLWSGEPLFVSTRAELLQRWPVLKDEAAAAFAGFPLRAGGRTLGLMAIAWLEDHDFDENERTYLTAVAEQTALALDRAITREKEAEEQEARAFVSEASLALSTAYGSPEQLLQELTDLVVPRLADWSSVLLRRGRYLQRVALAATPGLASPEVLDRAWAVSLDVEEPGPASQVLKSGRPLLVGGPDGEVLETLSQKALADSIGFSCAMVVPLTLHGRTTGVMTFVTCGGHLPYRSQDLTLAMEIAQRTAVAAEDAMDRHRDRELAEILTRALLPARFPGYESVTFAARYVPADAGPVGGDWYDVFELPGRRLAVVIGDVSGHGVEAASTMARLRMGLVAYATEGHDPSAIFERLAALLGEPGGADSGELLATLTYSVLDPGSQDLEVSSAGPMPWVLVRNAKAELIPSGGRALVAGMPAAPEANRVPLSSGDTLLFLTDGVIERHDEPVDDGLERLRQVAAEIPTDDLEFLCDEILSRTVPPSGRTDDCCLLAMRIG